MASDCFSKQNKNEDSDFPKVEEGISFILPIYNVAQYINDCIESIMKQNCEFPFEIVCVEDCSTDNTCSILDEIVKMYGNNNIKVARNDSNKGVSYSRNKGIRFSKYKYCWFVDPDDVLANGAASALYKLAEDNNADVVLGNYKRISENIKFKDMWINANDYAKTAIVVKDTTSTILPTDQNGKSMCAVWGGYLEDHF